MNPLMKAVEKGNMEMAQLLLDNGANASAADKVHTTPILHLYIWYHNLILSSDFDARLE